jgi:hypothetical protein
MSSLFARQRICDNRHKMPSSRLTILFSGMMAADLHQGGAIWAILQFVLGLKRLGHDVLFVEPIAESAGRPASAPLAASENAAFLREIATEFGLERPAALILAGTRETVGIAYEELREFARRADLLLNVSGMLTDPELMVNIPCRTYLDLDPAFNQLWQSVEGIDMRFAGHTHFVTIGQAIGEADCTVPTCGIQWIKSLQPIVLEHWPVADRIVYDGLTTVGNWRGYGSVEHAGVFYGQKAHSFRQFMRVPTMTSEKFMPAISIHADEAKDLTALADNGWHLLDPARVVATPGSYREFIQGSKAELGIAKSGYVASRCGWFSDRSVCYLASGRPVIAQETGFSRFLPTGAGLFAFSNPDQLLAAIDEMNADYAFHSQSARRTAEKHFDSDIVLSQLLQNLGLTA